MHFNVTGICNNLGDRVSEPCSSGLDYLNRKVCSSNTTRDVTLIFLGCAIIVGAVGLVKLARHIHVCTKKKLENKKSTSLYIPLSDFSDTESQKSIKQKNKSWKLFKIPSTLALFAITTIFVLLYFGMKKTTGFIDANCKAYVKNNTTCTKVSNYISETCEGFLNDIIKSITGYKK